MARGYILPPTAEDEQYMRLALEEAKAAADIGEIPVGAVVVCGGRVIASAHNERENGGSALCHAEHEAIRLACEALGGWRLGGCTLYVTLEPCPMCAGAAINARIPRIVYGAKDPAAGAFGSVINLNEYPLGYKPKLTRGVLEEECAALLRDFFARVRRSKKDGAK